MPQGTRGIWKMAPHQHKQGQGFKPPKFKNYLTISELALAVNRNHTWLSRLERAGRIPKAHRVQRGQLSIRLWSPAQVEEIRAIIATHKVGRPRKDEQ